MPHPLIQRHTGLPVTLGLAPIRRAPPRAAASPKRGEITALIELSYDDDVETCVMAPQELPDFAATVNSSFGRGWPAAVRAALSQSTRRRAVAALELAIAGLAIVMCFVAVVRALPQEPVPVLAKAAHRLSVSHLADSLRADGAATEPPRPEVGIPVIALEDLPKLGQKPIKPIRARAALWTWKRPVHRSISQRPLPKSY